MQSVPENSFAFEAAVAYRGKPMRVAGRLRLDDAAGQVLFRYLLSDDAGAPVLVEQAGDRLTLLRPFPPAAEPRVAGSTVTIGKERYTLAGTRRLQVREALGQVPGAAPNAPLLLSGIFQGSMGTVMRELALGTTKQVYYLVKPLAARELLSAQAHALALDAQRRAAGESDDD